MRKLLFAGLIATSSLFIACSNGGMSATAKKNLEVNDSIMNAYMAGDFSNMDKYIAADAIDHGGEKGDIVGLENIVAEMKRYSTMMTDVKATMTKSLADDEYVYTWSKMSAKMDGKPIEMSSMDVTKFKDGKAVEHWVYMDPKEMMAMMPEMGPPPPMDTTATMK